MYGLRPPDAAPGSDSYVRNRTRIIGMLSGLAGISSLCDRYLCFAHTDLHAVGKGKVNGKSVNRSSAAAAYARKLCFGHSTTYSSACQAVATS